ncbi:AmpG family muropeptide MFS transporter [Ancylobacter lacus]|uniref:AmpG family muropeptide MFS transporter n=1 Tax=Ancylobacter lacus TaxID=2579970 RepID=UPI001BCE8C55|nr:MFS transporter [Ancylobacter lacus]MBS7539552.1 MFS transporter [Ancylobacter lacus]
MTDTTRSSGPAPGDAAPGGGLLAGLAVYLRPRVLAILLLGFSSGLPLALTSSTFLIWMREAGVDLTTIGLFALVGTPYAIKFLWAPVVDALPVPLLTRWLGRRRGWLVFAQLLLAGAICLLASVDPRATPGLVALAALLVAAASATQDIVIDAYRIERLDASEQAAGQAAYVFAYRMGMLVSTAGALFLVSGLQEGFGLDAASAWRWGYLAMAGCIGLGIVTALCSGEPALPAGREAAEAPMKRMLHTAISAFTEFLGQRQAIAILAFVVLYKFCDAFAGAMTAPFVIDLGFTRTDYAAIVKGLGLGATLVGGIVGGMAARAVPLVTMLWIGAILQSGSNLAFAWLATRGHDYGALSIAIVAENFTGAIGTVIFVAYLSALCRNPLHTATQYALLTALAATGRTYLSASAGYVATELGWFWFFAGSLLTAVPSLLLLAVLQAKGHFRALAADAKS